MSKVSERAIFLQRSTYRQRRLRDALRMLPVLGLALWLFPLLWQGEGRTAMAVQFVFGVWVMLIILAAILARRLKPEAVGDAEEAVD